jgi:hypothetical protein
MPNIYIRVLQFARDNPGFTLRQLEQTFPDEWSWLGREIEHSNVFQFDRKGLPERRGYLSFEDAFRLLEHEEATEARKASTRATWFAGISLLLAVAVPAFEAYLSQS